MAEITYHGHAALQVRSARQPKQLTGKEDDALPVSSRQRRLGMKNKRMIKEAFVSAFTDELNNISHNK